MLLVDRAEGLVLIEDRGRSNGWRSGVGDAGAFDRAAHDAGQRLVGNSPDAAGLELTMATLEVVSTTSTVMAFTGAATDIRLDGQPARFGVAIAVPAGSVVTVRPPVHGCRVYAAVAGGIDAVPVLSSRSSDTLAQIGPGAVTTGSELTLGSSDTRPAWRGVAGAVTDLDRHIDAVAGPHGNLLLASDITAVVSPNSNRIGVRLTGTDGGGPADLPSFPVVPGAVQLTPSGELIVLGPDAGVTGGYPVIAVVGRAGLDHLAQCRPGTEVHLRIRRPRSAR